MTDVGEKVPTIFMVCVTNDDTYATDCSYTILGIDLKYALHLLKLMAAAELFAAASEGFYRVTYFHSGPAYFGDWIDTDTARRLEQTDKSFTLDEFEELVGEAVGDWVEMPDGYQPPDPQKCGRTSCPTIAVAGDSVLFHCYVSDKEIESPILTKAALTELANKLMELNVKQETIQKAIPRERVIQLDEGEES